MKRNCRSLYLLSVVILFVFAVGETHAKIKAKAAKTNAMCVGNISPLGKAERCRNILTNNHSDLPSYINECGGGIIPKMNDCGPCTDESCEDTVTCYLAAPSDKVALNKNSTKSNWKYCPNGCRDGECLTFTQL